ncbi:MAG TPA: arginine deiminase-related protein [Luteimonas sp.]|nr:arginine deiminase-related protein [Luteimonas sp.]
MTTTHMIAITRDVSRSLGGCELSFVPRSEIDLDLAATQHHAYQQALQSLGCRVLSLPAQEAMPDAVFIEDVALVLDEVAVMTRPGAASRRAEGASVAAVLAEYRPLLHIDAPGTLDGGDVLRVGRAIYVGQSARSNAAGIAQLRELVAPYGYSVQGVATRGCLHLKSAVTQVADDTLLIQTAWVDPAAFAGYRLIEIDPAEEHAANALRLGEGLLHKGVVYPDCFPRTMRRLCDAGIAVTTVDVSELQKAEGAVTCCSLVFCEKPV